MLVGSKYDAVVAFGCCHVIILNLEGPKNAFLDLKIFFIVRNNLWHLFTSLNRVLTVIRTGDYVQVHGEATCFSSLALTALPRKVVSKYRNL